jgi:Outer membrane protein beta-barrel domain
MFMKAKLSVLLAMVLLAQASMAQFHVGFKAGANISKIDGVSFDKEFRYGYHLGGFAIIDFGRLGIQPEVLFNQYTTTVDSNFRHVYQNVFSSTNNLKLNYLSIPILLNYKLIGNFLTLQAGPQFGILMNKQQTLLQNGQSAFKHGDFSMLAGLQLKILKFRIDGRYVVGLNNINDIGQQDKWRNQGFQVSVGMSIF